MVSSVTRIRFAKRLLVGGLPEQSIFVLDSNETLRKSRLDMLTKGNVIPTSKQLSLRHWITLSATFQSIAGTFRRLTTSTTAS